MNSQAEKKSFRIWVEAARPQTLPAAIVPVMIGASVAYIDHGLNWPVTILILICALLIQIGTNFANDYYDALSGADSDERVGFTRATAAGLIDRTVMKRATIITMILAFLVGMLIVWHAGWPIFILGVLSLICGIAYTGGPFPLGYNGLGDLFVFLFFGIVAVMGTYYANTLHWSVVSFWASLPAGALTTNILVVNNLRDVESDGPAGKKTLGVLLGENALRYEYLLMLLLGFAIPLHFYFRDNAGWQVLLPFLSLPLAIYLAINIFTETQKQNLNNTLKKTGLFLVLFGFLFSIGLIAA